MKDPNAERLRVLRYFGLLSVLTAPVFVYLYASLGGSKAVTALWVSVPLLALAFPIGKLSGSIAVAGNWILAVGYALFAVLSAYTGGIGAPALMWSACIPLMATLMYGVRSGLAWLVLVTIQFAVFYWFDRTGQAFPVELSSPGHLATVYFITALGLIYFTFLLGAVSEHFKARYLAAVEQSRAELREALEKVKTLKGLLPICAWCKKVRDDKGYWDQVEVYFGRHTDAEFSHGICPECSKKLIEREDEA